MHGIRFFIISLLLTSLAVGIAHARSCVDARDTYADYDDTVRPHEINDMASAYYVLSYTWTPRYCSQVPERSKQPGHKNYLQCGSGIQFGYILHGLWPQGALDGSGGYPRACEGDQDKIDRTLLQDYLCMTPSVWLLQHEYEYHGTCMHDESLETPKKYFDTAMALHAKLKLPAKQLRYSEESVDWFVRNNPHLRRESIQYYANGREWQFCYDNHFEVMDCPANSSRSATAGQLDPDCKVKGNISHRTGRRYYFTPTHPNYASVVITAEKGERCFHREQDAIDAGWVKAP